MNQSTLTEEQKTTLRSYVDSYQDWLKTEDGIGSKSEHLDHEFYFRSKLISSAIDSLDEKEFREMYKTLWASNVWTNKDWYIDNKLLKPNGLEKIKQELKNLLHGTEEISVRYDRFHKNIKGFGVSSISEILHFVYPEKYCLWNEKPKTVLPFLGLNLLPEHFFNYQISKGIDYQQCLTVLEAIKNEMSQFGIKDFVDLDIFFWYLYKEVIPKGKVEKRKSEKPPFAEKLVINTHEGAEYYLLELGKMLGFNPYTVDSSKEFGHKKLGDNAVYKEIPSFASEKVMSTVKEIDVIWFDDDENPKLCFEVEHSTNIVQGLERLVQLQHLQAKFFIVAQEDRRVKFDQLVTTRFPYKRLANRFRFISYDELANLFELTAPFYKLKTELLGE